MAPTATTCHLIANASKSKNTHNLQLFTPHRLQRITNHPKTNSPFCGSSSANRDFDRLVSILVISDGWKHADIVALFIRRAFYPCHSEAALSAVLYLHNTAYIIALYSFTMATTSVIVRTHI